MTLFGERFSNIERRERHEDIRLEKCHKKFEEPEWESKYAEGSSMERGYLFADIDDHTDEDGSDENIEKESHRE